MDIQLFDNYEDDGQLSLFRYDDLEYGMNHIMQDDAQSASQIKGAESDPTQPETGKKGGSEAMTEKAADLYMAPGGSGIRIQRCSSCGKLLFVKEEPLRYIASCNNCGIEYAQKI